LESAPSQVAVVGLGYVGCVTAACLASLGHRVTGVDRDAHKVSNVLRGLAPFYEPDLEELVRSNVSAGRLSATTSLPDAVAECDIALVCVGTPSEKNGNLGLAQLERVVGELAGSLAGRTRRLIVAIRSTVFPGTCEEMVIPRLGPPAVVVSNPEFLREGSAVNDFVDPSLLVIGGDDRAAVREVAALYAALDVRPCMVSLRTAEMIKYACNAFHAVKIAFANEIGALSDTLGIDAQEVMQTLCQDVKLNASAAYLRPGFAFGGSCLPKDLRALVYRAGRLDLKLPLVESALPSNRCHIERAVNEVLALDAERIGLIGLAFKENTDDLRESPVVTMLEQLLGKGRQLRVFDPHIQLDDIYGTNRQYLLETIPHIGKLLDRNLSDTLQWAQHLVVAQKQKGEVAERIMSSGLPILDIAGTNLAALSAART
jgi:GDP-mannose 6-dehydrogenase